MTFQPQTYHPRTIGVGPHPHPNTHTHTHTHTPSARPVRPRFQILGVGGVPVLKLLLQTAASVPLPGCVNPLFIVAAHHPGLRWPAAPPLFAAESLLPPHHNWCGTPPTPKHTHTHTHTHTLHERPARPRLRTLGVGEGPHVRHPPPPQLLHVTPKAPQNPQNLHLGGPNASLQSSLLTQVGYTYTRARACAVLDRSAPPMGYGAPPPHPDTQLTPCGAEIPTLGVG